MFLPDRNTRLFTDLYNQYYATIYSVAYARIRNVDTAKDLTQEVFIRFFSKLNTIENHRAWLLSALKLVILEHFKKNSRTDVDIDELNESITMSFVNGFRDSRIIIEEALNNIGNFGDEKGKIIFDLISLHHYTFDEVAKQIGMTRRQVRYRYSVIVSSLLDYFRSKGIRGLEDLL